MGKMVDRSGALPRCSGCGECCRAPVVLITKPEDYERWTRQGRQDILKYATVPPVRGYGDFWIALDGSEADGYCPFARRIAEREYVCTIQDTKPKVCREYWCEWSFGVGPEGVPFKTERGWTDRAKRLGYGKAGGNHGLERVLEG